MDPRPPASASERRPSTEQAAGPSDELPRLQAQLAEMQQRLDEQAAELDGLKSKMSRDAVELQRASGTAQFVANMSHELRTPLNAILGFAEMLKDGMLGELSERQRRSAKAIFDSGMHLLSLINDILDISRIEAGRMLLDLQPVDVSALLDSSAFMLKGRAAAHGIEIAAQTEVSAPVLLDARKARQIVYNLLSNAVKFTPDGGRVTLHARGVRGVALGDMQRVSEAGRADPEQCIELTVSDTGIGIDAADVEHLFQPFAQVPSKITREVEGSGLGLALVKQLVEVQGGVLAMTSRVGEGTTFRVWLPYTEAAASGDGTLAH